MLPYWFSAMTMKSVGSAALKMVEEVRRQFNTIPGLMEGRTKPDYANCVKISTDASLKEMIPPGALVMLTPLIAGTFFGVETLAGVLAGSLVSGVQVPCYQSFSIHSQVFVRTSLISPCKALFLLHKNFVAGLCLNLSGSPIHINIVLFFFPRLPSQLPTQEEHGIMPRNTSR